MNLPDARPNDFEKTSSRLSRRRLYGELIGLTRFFVRHEFSKTAGLTVTKYHMEPLGVKRMTFFSNVPRHITKHSNKTIHAYCKKYLKKSSPDCL